MEFSDLHKKLIEEGFHPLGVYANVSFSDERETHTTPPFKNIIENRHLDFRVIPAYLAFEDAPESYKKRHIVYIPLEDKTERLDLVGKECEPDLEI